MEEGEIVRDAYSQKRYRVVTRLQLELGYVLHHNFSRLEHREYRVVKDNGDGTFIVEQPDDVDRG